MYESECKHVHIFPFSLSFKGGIGGIMVIVLMRPADNAVSPFTYCLPLIFKRGCLSHHLLVVNEM